MIQDKFKSQLDQLQGMKDKLQAQLTSQLDKAAVEGKKLLSQLGVNTEETSLTLSRAVAQIRESNTSLKEILIKLDTATYDARKKISWDAHMMSAYAKLKAEETYARDVKPKLNEYIATAETRLKDLVAKAEAVKSKLVH